MGAGGANCLKGDRFSSTHGGLKRKEGSSLDSKKGKEGDFS
jgi:hypothetical protein